ncbi:MAG TPA: methyltransferase domain-containing protein [Candidatus Dormibacteraeota bacterium]|nr:methyltransferase domain-containing protein [Candidatus Dormibacteraeota bacterium]
MLVVVRCLRGIEWICAAEVAGLGARVLSIEHRLVTCEAAPGALLGSGTADDAFVVAGRFVGVDRRRAALSELCRQVRMMDLAGAEAAAGRLRTIEADAGFEVVASFLGRRNYNRFEIEAAVGEELLRLTGRRLETRGDWAGEGPALSWRVHLFDGGGFLGLRLSGAPLHRRPYRLRSQPGALHPPLAYAAAMLGGPDAGDVVVDPFCGVGTMLIEAASRQPEARLIGVDAEPAAIRAALANAARAGVAGAGGRERRARPRPGWMVGDAGRLALRAGAADVVLTNPPWSRRVGLAGTLAHGVEPFWAEAARVAGAAGRVAVVLEGLEGQAGPVRAAGLEPVLLQRAAVSGAWTSLGLLAAAGRAGAELDRLGALGLTPPPEAAAR